MQLHGDFFSARLPPMFTSRKITKDIWRSVVMAGAMLGTTACGGATSTATPTAPAAEVAPAAEANPCGGETAPEANPCGGTVAPEANPCGQETAPEAKSYGDEAATPAADPCADNPCGAKRPRGNDDNGPRGRGFVLG